MLPRTRPVVGRNDQVRGDDNDVLGSSDVVRGEDNTLLHVNNRTAKGNGNLIVK